MSNEFFQKHIPPKVKRETSLKVIFNKERKRFLTIFHGLWYHKFPEKPEKIITEDYFKINASDDTSDSDTNINVNTDEDTYYDIAMTMYQASKERIMSLEEKAFKLLTYISALSAILFFFLSKDLEKVVFILVVTAIVLLVFAMIISLRCIGIKAQSALYIDTLFDFSDEENVTPKTKLAISANLCNHAVYNHNVGDNTTDILRTARQFVTLSIIPTILALMLFIPKYGVNDNKNEFDNVNLIVKDSVLINYLDSNRYFQSKVIEYIDNAPINNDTVELTKNKDLQNIETKK